MEGTKNIDSVSKPKISFWVNKNFVVENTRPVPVLVHLSEEDTRQDLLYWNKLREKLPGAIDVKYYNDINDVEKGILLIPNEIKKYRNKGLLDEILNDLNAAKRKGLPVIVFDQGPIDFNHPAISLKFNTNLTRSKKYQISEYVIPNWLFDLGFEEKINDHAKPTVNFTCHVTYPNRINNLVRPIPIPDFFVNFLAKNHFVDSSLKSLSVKQIIANRVRRKLTKIVKGFREVEVTLKIRNKPFFKLPDSEKKVLKEEYRRNIRKCWYTIIIRGDGNGVFQLYEVMSAGRIPIIVDTNMALPTLSRVNWSEFSLIIPFEKIHKLEEYILEFHKQFTVQELLHKCKLSRQAYEELLPHNYVFNSILPIISQLDK